jgi:hypothetical protein
MASYMNQIVFERKAEPREHSGTVLVPQGWLLEGGIYRADFSSQPVTSQNIEAKYDLTIKKDETGTVMMRAVPEMKYCDPRRLTYGFFPVGSNYMGMFVYPILPPEQFLAQMMFPWAHPQASQVQMLDAKPWDEKIPKMQQEAAQNGINVAYYGGEATFKYTDMGVVYKEKAFVVITDLSAFTMGNWSNKATHFYRAPEAEFDDWEPVLSRIAHSLVRDPKWLEMENASQQILSNAFLQAINAQNQRLQNVRATQQYIQDSLRQIREHRDTTQAEIRNDMYLNLTNQEEYVNPYTQQIDTGSNEYERRWVTENGDEYYTNNESDNPNDGGGVLNRGDWKLTPVRPRRPYN